MRNFIWAALLVASLAEAPKIAPPAGQAAPRSELDKLADRVAELERKQAIQQRFLKVVENWADDGSDAAHWRTSWEQFKAQERAERAANATDRPQIEPLK